MTSNYASTSNEYRASDKHAVCNSQKFNEESNYVEKFKTVCPGIHIDDAFKYIENLDFKRIQAVQETQVKETSKCRPDTVKSSRPVPIVKRHSNKTESSRNYLIKPDAGRTSNPAEQKSDAAETLGSTTPNGGKPSKLAISAKEHSDKMNILKKPDLDAVITPKPAKLNSDKPKTSKSSAPKPTNSATGNTEKIDNMRSSTPKKGEGNTSKPAISEKPHCVNTENLSKLDDGNNAKTSISAQENSGELENSRKKHEKRTFSKLDNCKIMSKKHKSDTDMDLKQNRKVKEKNYEIIKKIKKVIQAEETNRKKSRGRPKLSLKDKLVKLYLKQCRGIYRSSDKSYESKGKHERQRISDIDAGSPEVVLTHYHTANATENADTGETKQPSAMSYATPSNPDEEEDDLIILSSNTECLDVYMDTEYIDKGGAKETEETSHSFKQPTNSPLETIRKRNTIILGNRKPVVNKPEVTTTIHKSNKNQINKTTLEKKGIDQVISTNANLNNAKITISVTPNNASGMSVKQRSLNIKENKGLIGMKISFASTELDTLNKKIKKVKKAIHTLHNVRRKKCTATASKPNGARQTVVKSKETTTPVVSKIIKKSKANAKKTIRKTYPDSSNIYGTVTNTLVGMKVREQQPTSPKPIADLDLNTRAPNPGLKKKPIIMDAAASGTKIYKSQDNQTKKAEKPKEAEICEGKQNKNVAITVPDVKKNASITSSQRDKSVAGSKTLQPRDNNKTLRKQHKEGNKKPQKTAKTTDANESNYSPRGACKTKDVLDKGMSYTQEVNATVADNMAKNRTKNDHKETAKMENTNAKEDTHIKVGPASKKIASSSSKISKDALEIRILRNGEIIATAGDDVAKAITKHDFSEVEEAILTSAKDELRSNGVSIVKYEPASNNIPTCSTKKCAPKIKIKGTEGIKVSTTDDTTKMITKHGYQEAVKAKNTNLKDKLVSYGVTIVNGESASKKHSTPKTTKDTLEIKILHAEIIRAAAEVNMTKKIAKRDPKEAEKAKVTSAKKDLHLTGVTIVKDRPDSKKIPSSSNKKGALEMKTLLAEEINGSTADPTIKKVTKHGFKETVETKISNLEDDLISKRVNIADAESVSKNIAPSAPKKANETSVIKSLHKETVETKIANLEDDLISNRATIVNAESDANLKEAMDSRTLQVEDMATKLTKEILREADKSVDFINLSKITTDSVTKNNASSTFRKAKEILDSRNSQTKDVNATTANNMIGKLAKDYIKETEIIREILDSRVSPAKEIRAPPPHNTTKKSVTNGLNATTVLVNFTSVKNHIKEEVDNSTTQKKIFENKLPQAHIKIFVKSDGSVGHTTEYLNETPSPKLNKPGSTELYRLLTNTPLEPETSTVIIAPPTPSDHKDVPQLNKDTVHDNQEQQRPIQKHKPPHQQPIRDDPNQYMPLAKKERLSAMGRLQYLADKVQENPLRQNMQHLPNNTFNPLQPRETPPQNTAYNSVKYAAGNMYNIPSHPHVNRQRYELPATPPQDKYNMRYTMNDAANWSQSLEKYQATNGSNIPSYPQIVSNHERHVLPEQPPQNTNKSSNYALHPSQEKYPPHSVNMPSLPQLVNHNQRQVYAQRSQGATSMQYSSNNRSHHSQEKYPPGYANIASPPQTVNNQHRHVLPGQLQGRHKMPYSSTNSVHASQLREEYLHNSVIKPTPNQTTINDQRHLLLGQLQDSHSMGYAMSNVLNWSPKQDNYVPANVNIPRQAMPAQLPQDKHMRYTLNHALQPQERYISPNVTLQPMPPLCANKLCDSRCVIPPSLQNMYSSNNAMSSQQAKNIPNTNATNLRDFAAHFFPEFTYQPTLNSHMYHDLHPPIVNINNNCNISYTNEEIRPISPPHRRKRKGTDSEKPSVAKRQKPIKDLDPLGTPAYKGFSSRNLKLLSVEELNSAADVSKKEPNIKYNSPSSIHSSKDTYSNLAPYGISVDKGPLPRNLLRSNAEINSSVSEVENVNSKIAPAQAPNTSQHGTRRPRYKATKENKNITDSTPRDEGNSRVLRLRSITDVNSPLDALEKVKSKIASRQEANNSSEDNHRRPDFRPDSQRHIPNPSTLSPDLEVIDLLNLNAIEKMEFKIESSKEPNTSSEDNNQSGADSKEYVKIARTVGPPLSSPHLAGLEGIDPYDPHNLPNVEVIDPLNLNAIEKMEFEIESSKEPNTSSEDNNQSGADSKEYVNIARTVGPPPSSPHLAGLEGIDPFDPHNIPNVEVIDPLNLNAIEKMEFEMESSKEPNTSSEDNNESGADSNEYVKIARTVGPPLSSPHLGGLEGIDPFDPHNLPNVEVIDPLNLNAIEKMEFEIESSKEPNTSSEDNNQSGADSNEYVKIARTVVGPPLSSPHLDGLEGIDPFDPHNLPNVAPRLNSTTKCDKSKLEDDIIDLTEDYLVVRKNNKVFAVKERNDEIKAEP